MRVQEENDDDDWFAEWGKLTEREDCRLGNHGKGVVEKNAIDKKEAGVQRKDASSSGGFLE